MLVDLSAIEDWVIMCYPVWADDDAGKPRILAWQVGRVKPFRMLGHHIGRVPPEEAVEASTLSEAITKFEEKTGMQLRVNTEPVMCPKKDSAS